MSKIIFYYPSQRSTEVTGIDDAESVLKVFRRVRPWRNNVFTFYVSNGTVAVDLSKVETIDVVEEAE